MYVPSSPSLRPASATANLSLPWICTPQLRFRHKPKCLACGQLARGAAAIDFPYTVCDKSTVLDQKPWAKV